MPLSGFKDLGVGVGLRPTHYDQFIGKKPASVSWVEVISENYMATKSAGLGNSIFILEKVRSNIPVILHGVSLSLGSVDPLDRRYLKTLKQLVDRIQPEWISDHLCWTGVNGVNTHDLLPLPYTEESLDLLVRKVSQVQDYFKRRILLENPSTYLQFSDSEMAEWEFLSELSVRADCGILLDVNNIYVSSVNHSFNPCLYLDSIPADRVGQMHLAGHRVKASCLIDTHDEPVCEEVWSLYQYAVSRFGQVSTMVERDGNIPPWSEMEVELGRVASIRRPASASQTNQTQEMMAPL